ncbi:MAG: VWA domain-containing protein [Myxococcota bacterium]
MNVESFHFLRPAWLLAALGLIPILWSVYRSTRSAGTWQNLCDAPLLRHLLVDAGTKAHRWPLMLLALGWLCASIALAGPSWERLPQPAFQAPSHTALVLDLSRSMRSRDVAPDRITRARYELLDLLKQIGGAVGLVIYAEEPYAVTPLTDDPRVIANLVPTLETGLMPGRGDRLDRALDEAHQLLARAGATQGRIVVIGDGLGDRPEETLEAAERAADAGFRVGVLGIGGNATELSRLAGAGDGVFAAHSADDSDLEAMLSIRAAPLAVSDLFEETDLRTDVWRDAGIWLVLVPLLLAPLAFRRGWAGALGLALMIGANAPSGHAAGLEDWFTRPDQQAAEAFTQGDHAAAADLFEDDSWRAAAQYRAGHYDDALESLSRLEGTLAGYNRGNSLARAGQLEQAIAAYDEVLAAEPSHDDARHNRELVQELLEQQQQEQQQQQPSPSSDEGEGEDSEQPQSGQDGEGAAGNEGDPEPSDAGDGDASASEPQGSNDASGADDPSSNADASAGNEPTEAEGSSEEMADAAGAEAPQSGSEAKSESSSGLEEEPSDPPLTSEAAGSETADAESEAATGPLSPGASSSPNDREPKTAGGGGSSPREFTEQDQEIEQRLNRIPDDPGGLLREKLRRRYAQKRYSTAYGR